MSYLAVKVETRSKGHTKMAIDTSPEAALSLPKKARRIVAFSISTVLLSGMGVAWAQVHHAGNVARDERIAAAKADAASLQATLDARITQELDELNAAIALAQTSLTDSEGQVDDDTVRQELSSAIEAALLAAGESPGTPDLTTTTVDGVDVAYVDVDFTATYPAATDRLSQATTAVDDARAAWVLARLGDAITHAQGVLAGSEGKVTDTALRDGLAAEISTALAIQAGASTLTETLTTRDALDLAAAAVTTDQTAWQSAEDLRIAAEEAERVRAEAAATRTPSTSPTRNGSNSTSNGRPNATSNAPTGTGAGSSSGGSGNQAGETTAPPAVSGGGGGTATAPPAEPSWGPSIVQATLPGVPAGYTCKNSPSTAISGDKGTNFAAWAASVGNPARFVATGTTSLVTVSAYFCYAN